MFKLLKALWKVLSHPLMWPILKRLFQYFASKKTRP